MTTTNRYVNAGNPDADNYSGTVGVAQNAFAFGRRVYRVTASGAAMPLGASAPLATGVFGIIAAGGWFFCATDGARHLFNLDSGGGNVCVPFLATADNTLRSFSGGIYAGGAFEIWIDYTLIVLEGP